ncbi:MAG: hypothetical protein K940chlam9_01358 [Chlamydiae bacterium]|nr:hypothetical protein [Chlamydiota bacterium]
MKEKKMFIVSVWFGFVLLSRLLKVSFPVGESAASIYCMAAALPVLAYFLPSRYSFPLVGGVFFLISSLPITAGIPTLLAALSWSLSKEKKTPSILFHTLFSALAISLFILSPSGAEAWPYALYWLIPIACSFVRPRLATRALSSTFIAHATGSVIWAYLVPLSSGQWLTLIPVVAVERLLLAALSVGLIGTIAWVTSLLPSSQPEASSSLNL